MSFSEINFKYTLPIINGFVQPADGQKRLSERVSVQAAMTAIPGSRVVDYRYGLVYTDPDRLNIDYSSFHDKMVFEFPEIQIDQAYGTNEDYHQVLRALGLA